MDKFQILRDSYLLAERLGKRGEADRLLGQIDEVRRHEPETITPRDEARLELDRIERLLYRQDGGGFAEAKQTLAALQERLPASIKEPSFYVYLAAAVGQEYLAAAGQPDEVRRRILQEALDAIEKAKAAGQLRWLQYLADPAQGQQGPNRDDDLVALAREPAVRQALELGNRGS